MFRFLLVLALLVTSASAQMEFVLLGDRIALMGGGPDGVGGLPHIILLDSFALVDGDDGKIEATAGSTWCWMPPGPVDTPTKITTTGHGASTGAALADFKEQVAGLIAAGFTPAPGACDQPDRTLP